jgi:hypothetical protein
LAGGGVHLLGRSGDGEQYTELLGISTKKTMKRRPTGPCWADLGRRLGYYLLCCAADKREGELAGQKQPSKGERRDFPFFAFKF